MSFLSFFYKKDGELTLLIDIGNGSVTCALSTSNKDGIPEILFVEEGCFSVAEDPDAKKLINDLSTTLDRLLQNLIKTGLKQDSLKNTNKKVSNSLVSFSSPWFVSKTKHLELKQETPFIITQKFLQDILLKEEEIFKKELLHESSGSNNPEYFDMVENSIVHTKINGYVLDNSLGKKTREFDAFLHLSIVGKNVIREVNRIINKYAHISEENVFVYTFPLVSFSVIRHIFAGTTDFIIMDVTADVSDLTLVQDNVIIKSVSMPSGRNFLLRQISRKMNFNSEIAESTLRLYISDKLDPQTKEKLQKILIDIEKEWSIYFENTLQELSPDMHLPNTMYLMCNDDVFSIYSDFIKLYKTDSTAVFRKNINITKVDKDTLSHFYNTKYPAKTNSFISILAIFFYKFVRKN